jgi:hypothetical protein
MSEQNNQIIACNPAAIHPDEREAHGLLAKEIFSSSTILETRELADGYGFRFPMDTTMLHKATKWIANERLCCPFFTFTLIVGEQFWIELSGTEGVKELIKLELLPMLESGDFPTMDELQTIYDEASGNSNS